MDRCFWVIDSKDTLLINAKDLFEDQQKVAKKVCSHFDIEYVPVEINYDVKMAQLNHTNDAIELNNVPVKVDFTEPPEVLDFTIARWVDDILENHPKLKYFM
jgi:autonomous glycyl radical cofactor GrcA